MDTITTTEPAAVAVVEATQVVAVPEVVIAVPDVAEVKKEEPKSVETIIVKEVPRQEEPKPVDAEPKLVEAPIVAVEALGEQEEPKSQKAAVRPEEVKPHILAAKPSVAVVVVETEVARLLQKLVTDDAPVTWSSLPGIVTKAMEIAEQVYGLNGSQKRQLVIDALTQLVRTVDKEAGISVADPVFEALLPSLVDHFVAVSKDGLSINVVPTTPASCFAFLCCTK